jgi:hypothetical protein
MLVKTAGLIPSPDVIMTAVKAASFSTAGRACVGSAKTGRLPETGVDVPEASPPGVREPVPSWLLPGTASVAADATGAGLSSLLEFCCGKGIKMAD